MYRPGKSNRPIKNLLEWVLSLSLRISCSSPPMKPFMRFSKDLDEFYRTANSKNKSLIWDFDDSLQRILLNIVKVISTPDQLAHACIERWKINLDLLYRTSQTQFEEMVKDKKPYRYLDIARIRFITEKLVEGSRFLYVGCGRGTECLSFANRGLKVIGIDTNLRLTETANVWSNYLALPFQAICMDVMELGFTEETFDSFLIEFYGHQPSLQQSLLLQRNLARVLRKGAQGFIIAFRKHYQSFWFLMRQFYAFSMVNWLVSQAFLDYRWGKSDAHEEKLAYGLYFRSHTVDSLSKELGYAFNVVECQYEKHDPRYVICIVEPKENLDSLPDLKDPMDWKGEVSSFSESEVGLISQILGQIEAICDFLEIHEKTVSLYFEDGSYKGKSLLQILPVEVTKFLRLLEDAFKSLPD